MADNKVRNFASILNIGIEDCLGNHFSIEVSNSVSLANVSRWTIFLCWISAETSGVLAPVLPDGDGGGVDGPIMWDRENKVGVAREVGDVRAPMCVVQGQNSKREQAKQIYNLNDHLDSNTLVCSAAQTG